MKVRSMQLPWNSFHGFMVLKVEIHLGRYLRKCNLGISDDYLLQHPSITVLQLQLSPVVALRKRHPTQPMQSFAEHIMDILTRLTAVMEAWETEDLLRLDVIPTLDT
ncbi:hypothetical protein TNCV_547861 [Trichonephila clavipes]|nr:hypothetical protein TNCV_547861 [Trichonephila clavipes]